MISLLYEKGTILIRGGGRLPNSYWDNRTKCFRSLALYYRDIVGFLRDSKVPFTDEVLKPMPCPKFRDLKLQLRDYQAKALKAWYEAGKWGTIALPTGSGKTLIAIKAISELEEASIVIVPTIDLLEQWVKELEKYLGVEVGRVGGGKYEPKAISVATYDSAYLRAGELGNKYPLVVFDEVHHLPAPSYSSIAEFFASPYRMGLTATYEREDGRHEKLPRLVGGKVFEIGVRELAGKHLAEYDLLIIKTGLTSEEREEYNRYYNIYLDYLRKRGLSLSNPDDFKRFIMMSGRDPKAREALLARHKARLIAMNSQTKIAALKNLLKKHKNDRILIFTEHNELAYRISRQFLLPLITHKTSKRERTYNLNCFKQGLYRILVTSKVLDEGVDVPEANVGIILSGSGSTREYRQRLGRLLRKKTGKKAVLYEIVSRATLEVGTSRRRHISVKEKLKRRSTGGR